jgi:mono/diheme cytochrome c family protein
MAAPLRGPRVHPALTLGAVMALSNTLGACSSPNSDTAPSTEGAAGATAAAELGQKLYGQNCVPCHREDGKGLPNVYPSLAQSPVVNGDPVELVRWVLAGERPASMPAGRYSTQMLKFGWMKDADAAALLTYVRSHFGNAAALLSAADVAAARP